MIYQGTGIGQKLNAFSVKFGVGVYAARGRARQLKLTRPKRVQLSPEIVRTLARDAETATAKELAQRYGVTEGTIWNWLRRIRNGKD